MTVILSVLNPEAPDQQQIEHPICYAQTNVSGVSAVFTLNIPEGYTGIVGGFTIDNETNGVYKAVGNGTYTFTITDGFALIVRNNNNWAQVEWNFRIDQTITYDWAHDHVDSGPLSNYNSTNTEK